MTFADTWKSSKETPKKASKMTFAIGSLDDDDFFDYEPYYTLPSPKFRSPGIKTRKAEPSQKVTTVSDLIEEYR